MTSRCLRLLLALPLLGALWGCTSATPEPEGAAFVALAEQTYPFPVVWECTVEAIENEGFVVGNTERDGDERGSIDTEFKVVGRDAISEAQEALRVRARVKKKGDKVYLVEVAPSRFRREYRRDEWSYVSQDAPLLKALERRLGESLRKRYRGK